jgi:hypothetical protein
MEALVSHGASRAGFQVGWNVVLESTRFFVWKTGLLPEND